MFNYIITYFKSLWYGRPPLPLHSQLWTDAEISTAINMSANNCTTKQIAESLNRSESAVYQKLRKLQGKQYDN